MVSAMAHPEWYVEEHQPLLIKILIPFWNFSIDGDPCFLVPLEYQNRLLSGTGTLRTQLTRLHHFLEERNAYKNCRWTLFKNVVCLMIRYQNLITVDQHVAGIRSASFITV